MDSSDKFNIGLCLSGGGVKGLAHLGIIAYLEEMGISPDILSGTSAGAIVGAFYAAGYPARECVKIFQEINIFRIPHLAIGRPGIFNIYRLRSQLEKYFPENSFQSLKKQLFIHTTDLESGEECILHEGDLISAIFASSAIPFLFAPVVINDRMLTDGGVTNNFPVDSIRDKCKTLIGINVEGVRSKPKKELSNSIRIIERAMEILIHKQSLSKVELCDIYIEFPELNAYSILDFKKMEEIFQLGYSRAKQSKDEFERYFKV